VKDRCTGKRGFRFAHAPMGRAGTCSGQCRVVSRNTCVFRETNRGTRHYLKRGERIRMPPVRNTLGIVFFPGLRLGHQPHAPRARGAAALHPGPVPGGGALRHRRHRRVQTRRRRSRWTSPGCTSACPMWRVITKSHLISAGGAIRTARLVMEKERDKGFALVRPPGHHAMKVVHGAAGSATSTSKRS
jgi:hypothetical protein